MPRPRFERLPDAKRARILEAAAIEFAACGYEQASLNSILEQAGISKGAAYYYFDDKADLYITTLRHYLEELWADLPFDIGRFTPERFWSEVADVYSYLYVRYHERPWVLGMVRSSGTVSMGALAQGPLAPLRERAEGLLARVVHRGRDLGLVRQDVPDDLLRAWVMGIDNAQHRWLQDHGHELSPDAIEAAAERMADALRRLLTRDGILYL